MVRAYKMKGKKRKNKGEKYDREEEEQQEEEHEPLEETVAQEQQKKMKTELSEPERKDEQPEAEAEAEAAGELPGIPIVPVDNNVNKPGVVFILEKASLEIAKVGKTYQLLSSDEHANFLVRNKRNPADYRPDIAFQV